MEKVCIIGGAGHIGLPLGVIFARKGINTRLLDINEKNLALIKQGKFPFREEGGEVALAEAQAAGNLEISLDPVAAISGADIIVLAVDTPTGQFLDPSYGRVIKVFEDYLPYFQNGQTVILRSTVYPGMSERVQWLFNQSGKNIDVAFCPERIVQGKALQEQEALPQIISAFNKLALERVKNLFSKVNKDILEANSPLEAELAKLFSNAWRYISFATANQFYLIASSRGINYPHLHEIMTHKYERNQSLPKPGFAAGPCLVKDTAQVLAFSNGNFQMGQSAIMANEGLPQQILEQLRTKYGASLREKSIGILGMAFKAESDDNRHSLSYKLRDVANLECKSVLTHDVYIKDEQFTDLDTLLKQSDIIILATPHLAYQDINPALYPGKDFVDIWGAWS